MASNQKNLFPVGTSYSERQKVSALLDLNMFVQATYFYIQGAIDKFPTDELELVKSYIDNMRDNTALKNQLAKCLDEIDHLLDLYKNKQSFKNEEVPPICPINSRESAEIVYGKIVHRYNYKRTANDIDNLCEQFSNLRIESEQASTSITGKNLLFFRQEPVYTPKNYTGRFPNLDTTLNIG